MVARRIVAIAIADIVLMGDRLGGVMDAYEIGTNSYSKTKQNLSIAFGFNGIGVPAAMTGLVHPVFAMLAMLASVTFALTNSFGGQLVSGESINLDFSTESESPEVQEEDETEEAPEKPAREHAAFDVNMTCEGCERRIRSGLLDRQGVTDVQTDVERQRVTVEYDPHAVDHEVLVESIREKDFEVSYVTSTP